MTERELWIALADDCEDRIADSFAFHPGLCIMAPRLYGPILDIAGRYTISGIYDKIEAERTRLGRGGVPMNQAQQEAKMTMAKLKEILDNDETE